MNIKTSRSVFHAVNLVLATAVFQAHAQTPITFDYRARSGDQVGAATLDALHLFVNLSGNPELAPGPSIDINGRVLFSAQHTSTFECNGCGGPGGTERPEEGLWFSQAGSPLALVNSGTGGTTPIGGTFVFREFSLDPGGSGLASARRATNCDCMKRQRILAINASQAPPTSTDTVFSAEGFCDDFVPIPALDGRRFYDVNADQSWGGGLVNSQGETAFVAEAARIIESTEPCPGSDCDEDNRCEFPEDFISGIWAIDSTSTLQRVASSADASVEWIPGSPATFNEDGFVLRGINNSGGILFQAVVNSITDSSVGLWHWSSSSGLRLIALGDGPAPDGETFQDQFFSLDHGATMNDADQVAFMASLVDVETGLRKDTALLLWDPTQPSGQELQYIAREDDAFGPLTIGLFDPSAPGNNSRIVLDNSGLLVVIAEDDADDDVVLGWRLDGSGATPETIYAREGATRRSLEPCDPSDNTWLTLEAVALNDAGTLALLEGSSQNRRIWAHRQNREQFYPVAYNGLSVEVPAGSGTTFVLDLLEFRPGNGLMGFGTGWVNTSSTTNLLAFSTQFAGSGDDAVVVATVPDEVAFSAADLNADGGIDGTDLAALLALWDTDPSTSLFPATRQADLNADGIVDGADLAGLLAAWAPCP